MFFIILSSCSCKGFLHKYIKNFISSPVQPWFFACSCQEQLKIKLQITANLFLQKLTKIVNPLFVFLIVMQYKNLWFFLNAVNTWLPDQFFQCLYFWGSFFLFIFVWGFPEEGNDWWNVLSVVRINMTRIVLSLWRR